MKVRTYAAEKNFTLQLDHQETMVAIHPRWTGSGTLSIAPPQQME